MMPETKWANPGAPATKINLLFRQDSKRSER